MTDAIIAVLAITTSYCIALTIFAIKEYIKLKEEHGKK